MNALKFKCICFLQEHEKEWFLLQILYPHLSGKEAVTFLSCINCHHQLSVKSCLTTTASYAFLKKNYSGSDRFFLARSQLGQHYPNSINVIT